MGYENEKWFDVAETGIKTCIAWHTDVIVLSPGPPGIPFQPQDPLQMVTREARSHAIPVLLSAAYLSSGMFQALEQDNWIISVGAIDAKGQLLPGSGTGREGAAGPAVVSYGIPVTLKQNGLEWERFTPHLGFAVSRVASVTAFVRGCLRLIASDWSDRDSGDWPGQGRALGMPLVGVVDTGVEPHPSELFAPMQRREQQHFIHEFSCARTERERDWYRDLHLIFEESGASCSVSDDLATIGRTLRLLSLRLEHPDASRAGAGLVTFEGALQFFAALTPERWINMFCPHLIDRLGPGFVMELNGRIGPLWDDRKVAALKSNIFDRIQFVIVEVF